MENDGLFQRRLSARPPCCRGRTALRRNMRCRASRPISSAWPHPKRRRSSKPCAAASSVGIALTLRRLARLAWWFSSRLTRPCRPISSISSKRSREIVSVTGSAAAEKVFSRTAMRPNASMASVRLGAKKAARCSSRQPRLFFAPAREPADGHLQCIRRPARRDAPRPELARR
jgi:hypothetical protein